MKYYNYTEILAIYNHIVFNAETHIYVDVYESEIVNYRIKQFVYGNILSHYGREIEMVESKCGIVSSIKHSRYGTMITMKDIMQMLDVITAKSRINFNGKYYFDKTFCDAFIRLACFRLKQGDWWYA